MITKDWKKRSKKIEKIRNEYIKKDKLLATKIKKLQDEKWSLLGEHNRKVEDVQLKFNKPKFRRKK